MLRDSPEMLAAGQFASYVPGRPDFPDDDNDIMSCIAIGSKKLPNVQWFLFRSEETMV